MKTMVILSGGMDSTALLYGLKAEGEVEAVSFDYGQRHKIELNSALRLAIRAGVTHHIIDLSDVGRAIAGKSALLAGAEDIPVPEGHYAEANMAITVVPNRNMIMASIAAGVAWARDCTLIALGVHAGDHAVYPDCRPDFVDALDRTLFLATEERIGVIAPFIYMSKAQIVTYGEQYGVPWELTHTCYNGKRPHCGRCSTCVERIEAFDIAGVEDPMGYEPGGVEYARSVVAAKAAAEASVVSSGSYVPKNIRHLPLFRQDD
jgi:7-cyano-7-deazaguanine synthase